VLKKNNKKLEAFISASAIGIYGAVNGQEIVNKWRLLMISCYTCQKGKSH
jgi:NAD dependent epimerase/dehydratase family enzyme